MENQFEMSTSGWNRGPPCTERCRPGGLHGVDTRRDTGATSALYVHSTSTYIGVNWYLYKYIMVME